MRDLKKELEEKKQLEHALKERDYESVKVELERTRHRIMTLEGKVPPEHKSATSSQHEASPQAGDPLSVVI